MAKESEHYAPSGDKKPSRMAKCRAELRKRGGGVKQVHMEAGDLANLAELKRRHQLKTDGDAVSWAMQVALNDQVKRRPR